MVKFKSVLLFVFIIVVADSIVAAYAKVGHSLSIRRSGKLSMTFTERQDVFPECHDGKCECGSKYIGYNNVCYGLLDAKCFKPSNCLSTSYSCVSGTCQNVEHKEGEITSSSKPGVGASWIDFKSKSQISDGVFAGKDDTMDVHVCRGVHQGLLIPAKLIKFYINNFSQCDVAYLDTEPYLYKFEMLRGSNLKWSNSSYPLDKAVYGGATADNKPYLICRTKHIKLNNQIIVGNLVPPLYNICVAPFGDKGQLLRKIRYLSPRLITMESL